MGMSSTLLLLLGAYLGNPDNSNASNQAVFDDRYANFVASVGAQPALLNSYIDYGQTSSKWVENSAWAAASFAASPNAGSTIPVIALPMASLASGSASADAQFQSLASGAEDEVLTGIVNAWTDRGFRTLVVRPGWEMNLPGPTYAGNDPASDADWIRAFQHVYAVLHRAASAAGASIQVVWNPGTTNYGNPVAITALYPGDDFVDVVGADFYADIYPYSDGGSPSTYHDWDTGGQDSSVAQFIADPVNRAHYWSYPAATRWSLDGSAGHNQGLPVLMQFAKAHAKPFAIPETGAGNSNSGTDVQDDAAFPGWLAQQLSAYEATTDILDVTVSEDAWLGDAEFTVTVDGQPTGNIYTATAQRNAGATQDIAITGSWGRGPHVVTISFINDAYAGTAATDRNLYLDSLSYDGNAVSNGAVTFLSNATSSFAIDEAQARRSAVSFVNIWNSNGGGDYEFSYPSDQKPAELAAWMQYFGAGR